MLGSSKALALLVVAFSCMCDASHNGGMQVRGPSTRPLHVALARTIEEIPIVDHQQALSLRAEDADDHSDHDHDATTTPTMEDHSDHDHGNEASSGHQTKVHGGVFFGIIGLAFGLARRNVL